jgi:hypothetical protein
LILNKSISSVSSFALSIVHAWLCEVIDEILRTILRALLVAVGSDAVQIPVASIVLQPTLVRDFCLLVDQPLFDYMPAKRILRVCLLRCNYRMR